MGWGSLGFSEKICNFAGNRLIAKGYRHRLYLRLIVKNR